MKCSYSPRKIGAISLYKRAIFDLLRKDDLAASDIKRVKAVAVGLLETLKAKKLRVDQWREKETTRDAVRVAIRDFLRSDDTGLPVDTHSEAEVEDRTEEVYGQVYRAYPSIPSPFYERASV